MSSPVVSVAAVDFTYGGGASGVKALTEVHMEVYPGEVVLLTGPSGSGKTTLIQVLGCLLRPGTGSVRLHGREVTGLPDNKLAMLRLRHFGFVFQGCNLFPTLPAWANVAVAFDLHGIGGSEAEQRSRSLLAEVGLEDRAHALPGELSGGQKQRVAIARALAGDPDVILADEPTAALDSVNGARAAGLLRGLAVDHGRAVVIVTHDNRIFSHGDRIIGLEDGRIVREQQISVGETA